MHSHTLDKQRIPTDALRLKSYTLPLVGLLLVRVLQTALLYRQGYIGLTADEFGRTVIAAEWAQRPHLFLSGVWLPIHFYLLGTALKIHWDLLLVPRLVTIILGFISIIEMYHVGRALTGDRNVGLLSAFLLTVNPAHLWLSSTALSEVPYTVFLLGAIYGTIRYAGTQNLRWLLLSCAMLSIANGFRFEGWFVSVIFSGYLAYCAFVHRGNRIAVLKISAFMALVWAIPISWMIGGYIESGNILSFASSIQSYKSRWYGSYKSLLNYIGPIWTIDWLLLIVAIPSLIFFFLTSRGYRIIFTIFHVLPFAIFIILHGGQLEPPGNYIRYLSVFLFGLYPVIALLLYRLGSRVMYWGYVLGVLCLLFGVWQTAHAFQVVNDPSTKGIAAGQELTRLRQADPAGGAVIEVTYWHYLALEVGASDVGVLYDRVLDVVDRSTTSFFIDRPDEMKACLAQKHIALIVVASDDVRQVIEGAWGLRSVSSVNGYTFYRTPAQWGQDEALTRGRCTLYDGVN